MGSLYAKHQNNIHKVNINDVNSLHSERVGERRIDISKSKVCHKTPQCLHRYHI